MSKKLYLFLFLIGFILLQSACQVRGPGKVTSAWKRTEVRLIDEIDSTQPELELVALYSRQAGDELQVRLDFLNLTDVIEGDLYLAVDHSPGGLELPGSMPHSANKADIQHWDTLIEIPETGEIEASQVEGLPKKKGQPVSEPAWQPLEGAAVRVVRNPQTDSVEISLKRSSLDPIHSEQPPPRLDRS